jgi:hypothetical protein
MVRRDGGRVSLVRVADDLVVVSYRPGADSECADGACVLPHAELQQLMSETLIRQEPKLKVVVELAR